MEGIIGLPAKCQRLMHGIVELKSYLTLDYYHIGDNRIIDDYCDPSVRSMLFKRSPFLTVRTERKPESSPD
jgi:hypothetical protein